MLDIQSEADAITLSNKEISEKVKELCLLLMSVPYKRIGSLDPEDMIREGKGSCTPKHVFLARQLQKMRISTQFLIIPFYYKKMVLPYKKEDSAVVENMPISYHVALKANIDGIWRVLDVTWDKDLKGFPLNRDWDGKSDMQLAVIPEKVIERNDDPRVFEKQKLTEYSTEDLEARKLFYKAFDVLLDEARAS